MTYPNILVFVDFPVDDVEAASDFYRTVMGWEVETRIPGVFNRIVPGQNFKLDDGSQGPTGNLHMGISYAGDARPDPRPDGERDTPARRMHDGARTTRAWILVSDDDEMDAIMDRAAANGGTIEQNRVSVSYLTRLQNEPRGDLGKAEAGLDALFPPT